MDVIVTLTMNPTIDKSATVKQIIADQKLRCNPPRYEPGGGGINVSRAIKRLAGQSMALYPAGGAIGHMLQDLLDQEELNHRPLPIKNQTRQNFTAFEESSERQFRFGMPGPQLEAAEWQRSLDELSSLEPEPDYIIASGSLPPGVPADFYARLARLGRDRGCRVVVDTKGEALRQAADAGVYLLKPNLRELNQLAERELKDEAEREAVAKELVERGNNELVVISLGAAGALLVSPDGTERVRAPTVPIRSKIGAGDSTVAGIILALARGRPLSEAVRYGVAAGAAAVMTPGTELCGVEDTDELYEEISRE